MGCTYLALVDPSRPGHYPPCPFRLLTGRSCPGCGITRGLHQLFTGHPVHALQYNLLLGVLVPGVGYLYARWALPRWGGPRLPAARLTARWAWAAVLVIVAFGVLRNLPWEPFRSLSALGA